MASRASYPDVDRSLNQISFQVAPAYQPKSKKQNLIHHQRLNLSQLEVIFNFFVQPKITRTQTTTLNFSKIKNFFEN